MENMKPQNRLKESLTAKMIAFLLCIVLGSAAAAAAFGTVLMQGGNIYSVSGDIFVSDLLADYAKSEADHALSLYLSNGGDALGHAYEGSNLSFSIFEGGRLIYGNDRSADAAYSYESDFPGKPATVHPDTSQEESSDYAVYTYVDKEFSHNDYSALVHSIAVAIYALRFSIYWIAGACLLIFALFFIFLIGSTGHRRDTDGIYIGFFSKIPFDLFTVGLVLMIYQLLSAAIYVSDIGFLPEKTVLFALILVVIVSLFLGWCLSLAKRIKLGAPWRNTLIYRLPGWTWKLLKRVGRFLGYIKNNFSLVWETVIILLAAQFVLIALHAFLRESVLGLAYWVLDILLMISVLYIAIMLHKLQAAGCEIARGNLDCRVDTKNMIGGFKKHAEDLNSISLGMARAVDERMKSERLKTELITNVSHDIKTPLTSIINYSDLISRAKCDDGKMAEYIEVLSRQSERLKKLIVDLIEVSKASTGNIEVSLAPCDAEVLLTQAIGEFEEKLSGNSLELIITKPKDPVMIMADGKLLWRVFDNLMDNVCKYTMPGTRVYLSLEEVDGEAVISFKNTSKSPLNIKAEELMERFVRGDSSRHTEGSGLGLSIARSLVELQSGIFSITIDGDFFRADLRFKQTQEQHLQ